MSIIRLLIYFSEKDIVYHPISNLGNLRGFDEFLCADIMFLFVLFDGKLEKLIEPSPSTDIAPVLLAENAATCSIQRSARQSAHHSQQRAREATIQSHKNRAQGIESSESIGVS